MDRDLETADGVAGLPLGHSVVVRGLRDACCEVGVCITLSLIN